MAEPVVQTIHRDPALFYWILLPITVVMILTGILRHYLSTLLQTTPKVQALPAMRQTRYLMRGVNLRNNLNQLLPAPFAARRAYMVEAFKNGVFLAEPEMRGKPRPNPMTDPAMMEGMMGMMKGNVAMIKLCGTIMATFPFIMPMMEGMMGMMKGNVAMMVPQSLIMGWINAFFSGYVIMKLPFPLTPQFKSMLQSGVGTRDLDVRWVSSLSWYFLTLFGLQPVYNFILGSNNAASQVSQQMAQAQGGAMPGMGPEQDPDKLFASEAENLEVLEHKSILEGVEDRLLASLV